MPGLLEKDSSVWTTEEVKKYVKDSSDPAIRFFEKAFDRSKARTALALEHAADCLEYRGLGADLHRWPPLCESRILAEVDIRAGVFRDRFFRVDALESPDTRPRWLDDELLDSGLWDYSQTQNPRKVVSIFQAFLRCAWSANVRKTRKQRENAAAHCAQQEKDTELIGEDFHQPQLGATTKVRRWLDRLASEDEQENDDYRKRPRLISPPIVSEVFPVPARAPFTQCVIYFGDLSVADGNYAVNITVRPILMSALFTNIFQYRRDQVEPVLKLQAHGKKVYFFYEARGTVAVNNAQELAEEIKFLYGRMDTVRTAYKIVMYLAQHQQIVEDMPPALRSLEGALSYELSDETAAMLVAERGRV